MEKPKIIQHLINIGFKEETGRWLAIWGQGDGEYYKSHLTRGEDVIYTDQETTHYKYSLNGILFNEQDLFDLT